MNRFIILLFALLFFYSCDDNSGNDTSQECLTQKELQDMNIDCTTEALEKSCARYACNIIFEFGFLGFLQLDNIQTPNLDESCQIDDCNTISCINGDIWTLDFDPPSEILRGSVIYGQRTEDRGIVSCTEAPIGQETIPFPILDPSVSFPDCTDDPKADFPDCPTDGITMICPKPTTPPINLKSSCTYINSETEEIITGEIFPAECEVIDCFTMNCKLEFLTRNFAQFELMSVPATLTTNFDEEDLFKGSAIIDRESGFEGSCEVPL